MGQQILIAEPCNILRIGLRVIFTENTCVSEVHEAATDEALKVHLRSSPIDLVVINQVLVMDIALLPRGNFVILTNEPDLTFLQAAYQQGARGYLSISVSVDLLRTMLHPVNGSFLLDPTLTPWLMESLSESSRSSLESELFTRREQEIMDLLRSGLSRRSIAQKLHISETTLKTHLRNIARKRNSENHLKEVLSDE